MDRDERIYAIADDMFQTIPVLHRRVIRPDACGISPLSPRISVLVVVKREGPISMSSIAQALSYSKQNLTKIVNQLVNEGYVDRIPDPSDRRVLNIKLTEKGRSFMAERRERMKNKLMEDLSHLNDEELEYLYDTFERVKMALPKLLVKDVSDQPRR
ncbi:MAG: MarR family transcriptional regulator [Methanomassiliicoccales archaeon]|jgi:DNA-binding MarR family transcriptional regulator